MRGHLANDVQPGGRAVRAVNASDSAIDASNTAYVEKTITATNSSSGSGAIG